MNSLPVLIDCYGHKCHQSVEVVVEGHSLQFVFADRPRSRTRFHLGAFVDYHASSGHDYLRYPRSRRVAILSEPNASEPFVRSKSLARRFSIIFTHDVRLLELGEPFEELPFGTCWLGPLADGQTNFSKSRLVSMIGAPHPEAKGGHGLRNQVIERLKIRGDVDQFGKGIRWIDSKLEGLADYAFSIAMENASRDYYFTEKIIDCFMTDTVPIYWGCPGISRYFDPDGILHFETMEQLEVILDNLSWEKYTAMLPFVLINKQRAVTQRMATREQLFERVGTRILHRYGDTVATVPSRSVEFVQFLWRSVFSRATI
jgi:hypothetical protein